MMMYNSNAKNDAAGDMLEALEILHGIAVEVSSNDADMSHCEKQIDHLAEIAIKRAGPDKNKITMTVMNALQTDRHMIQAVLTITVFVKKENADDEH